MYSLGSNLVNWCQESRIGFKSSQINSIPIDSKVNSHIKHLFYQYNTVNSSDKIYIFCDSSRTNILVLKQRELKIRTTNKVRSSSNICSKLLSHKTSILPIQYCSDKIMNFSFEREVPDYLGVNTSRLRACEVDNEIELTVIEVNRENNKYW